MMGALDRLAFLHRTLWRRDQAYRVAALLGPPPLVGCAVAAALWLLLRPVRLPPGPDAHAPWAHQDRAVPDGDQPYVEAPDQALPPADPHGGMVGFQTGWQGEIHPMTVNASMDADVLGSVQARFAIDQPTIPLSLILDAGPPQGLFVGTANTLLVIRSAGLYALSARLQRSSALSANCIVRLRTTRHRLVRNINAAINGDATVDYRPTEFRLRPGLYLVAAALGCWRGEAVIGPGELTLMIRHPREVALQPVRADEVIRPRRHADPR